MAIFSLPEWVAAFDHVAPLLVDAAVRSVVILGVAAVAALALRRASAAARHWAWVLGFAGVLLLPVLSANLPGWHVLPRMDVHRAAPAMSPAVDVPVLSPAISDFAAPPSNAWPPAEALSTAPTQSTIATPPAVAPAAAVAPVQVAADTSSRDSAMAARPGPIASPAAAAPATVLPWAFWLVILWLSGSLLVLGQVVLGNLSLWVLQRRCARITAGGWIELLRELQQLLHLRRAVDLLQSPQRTMPMTWGVWRTRILLPEDSAAWPPAQRRAVLLHELGHARRWDCLTQLLAQMACAVYWFNPLVWVAWRRMQVERERACDDLVLNAGAKASTYAEHLLHSASALPGLRFVGAAVAMARPSTLEERLRAILDGGRNRRAMSSRAVLGTIVLLLAFVVPVAVLKAQEASAPPMAAAPEVPLPPGYSSQNVTLPPGYSAQNPPTPAAAPADTTTPAPATPPAAARGARAGQARGGRGPQAVPPQPARGGRAGNTLGGQTPAVLGEGPTTAFDATIYDVRLPVDQIGRLDVAALTRAAATAADFEKALAALGPTVPLYRANQSVRLSDDSILLSSSTPYITNSQTTGTGQVINTVTYRDTGASFIMAGKATASGSLELDLAIQVSTLSDSTVPIAGNIKAPIFRIAQMSHKGPVEAGKAFVVLNIDADHVDAAGKAVAYIARITMGAPQSAPATLPAPARGPRSDALDGPASGDLAARPLPTLNEGPTTGLDATIYDVRVPTDQIGRLDAAALTRAATTAADFEKALAALGSTQSLYRANQSVRLAGDRILLGTSTPYITNSQINATGNTINSVAYRQTGATFSLTGKATTPGNLELEMAIQLSTLSEGTVAISDKVKAPLFRDVQMSHKGPVEAGKAFVILNIDADHVDATGKAVAYIARITLGAPQAAPAPAANRVKSDLEGLDPGHL